MEPNDMNLKSASKQNKADRIMFSVLIFLVWFGGFFFSFSSSGFIQFDLPGSKTTKRTVTHT